MSDNLPPLSHLQFAVLQVVGASQMSGRDLRAGLRELGINKSGPAFYQLMARLEESKQVEGWYIQEIVDGQIIKERQYKITGSGVSALNRTKSFYKGKTQTLRWAPTAA
jgi:hypothetical protein